MFAILLVILGIFSRVIVHTPQFTATLAVALFAGMYLNKRLAWIVPVGMMLVTDVILGFHDTMLFTYGSMLGISAIGIFLKNRKSYLNVFAGSIGAALLFFVVTNFGAFLSLYPRTWGGLYECYILAIPFFRSTLLSTVAYSLVLYAAYEALQKYQMGKSCATQEQSRYGKSL